MSNPEAATPQRRSSDHEPQSALLMPGELQDIADRQKTRNSLAFVAAVLQGIATIAFVVIALILLSASAQSQSLSKRDDCKTTYNSILSAPVTHRDDLQAQVSELSGDLSSQLGAALLQSQQGIPVTQAQVTQFANTKTTLQAKTVQLETSIATVSKLPTLATAAMKGFTLNGVHYAACPKA